jgi:thioredoxin 1
MGKVKTLSQDNFDSELAGNGPLMVDFYTDWCGPCQILAPSVEQIAADYNGRARVGKLNVDLDSPVAARYGIQGIPTVLFFKDGQLVDRVVGLVPSEQLAGRLESLLD